MKTYKQIIAIILSCLLIFSVVLPISTTTADAATTKKIADVKPSHYSYQAVQWAVSKGYLTLDSLNKFYPNTPVKEWHVLKMLATIDDNYNLSIDKTVMYQHYGNLNVPLYGVKNSAKREANISRGHFARIYAAMNGLDLSEAQAVQYLYLNEITSGTTGKRTYEDYKPNQNITRADLAVFMQRIVKQGKIALEGLAEPATGKDNGKVTLPTNFIENKGTAVEIPSQPSTSVSDKEIRPDVYKAVKSIDVENESLIANGKDSTLITIQLRDSYGNDIPYDESLEFKVSSSAGATFSGTGTSTSGNVTTVFSDGPELNVFVTAPALTKSIVDSIRFEMVNPSSQYYTYKNQVIQASVRYVPTPELRISYEVFDPDQTDWAGSDVEPGVKPLPALPEGKGDGGATVPFTEKGIITVTNYDEDTKLLTGSKWETYTNPTTGQLAQGNVTSKEIQYGNAELKLEGQTISVWLFEQILKNMIYDPEYDTEWGGVGSAKVMYTINKEGRATYDLQGVMDNEHMSKFETTTHAAIVYLIRDILPKADGITLAHEESVVAIKVLYDRLSQIDKNIIQKDWADVIGKLEGAVKKIDVLNKGKELQQRPEGMDRYTKVIVNLVAPSGVVITDYRGTVEIEFNGKTKLVSFDTNTKDYNNGTGYAGSAVAYFDDILYGYSTVTAKLVDTDTRYTKVFQSLYNTKVPKKIFTNSKFDQKACKNSEIAFLVDHSGSMKSKDKDNFTAAKVKQMIQAAQADPTHAYRYSNKATFESSGPAETVASTQNLLQYQSKDSKSTELVKSATTVLNNFSNNNTNKVLVIITDGKAKKNGLENMKKLAQSKGVKIFTISVGKYNTVNESLLKGIASDTGGQYFNVTDVYNLHSPFVSILSALCGGEVETGGMCLIADSLFNEGSVKTTKNNVSMEARINESCSNVAKVIVVFTANSGKQEFELTYRNNGVYKLTEKITQFKQFNLYRLVEIEAYDASGKLIATKEVTL